MTSLRSSALLQEHCTVSQPLLTGCDAPTQACCGPSIKKHQEGCRKRKACSEPLGLVALALQHRQPVQAMVAVPVAVLGQCQYSHQA